MIVLINFPKDSDNFTKNNNFLKIFDEYIRKCQKIPQYDKIHYLCRVVRIAGMQRF